ncbi:putative phosphohydrolase [Schinkia azotoformans MEV2011]|uniref:Putative phosphohydrolase n=2 Tax=Schinkia azotoformans TaxID=1454 RepID=A0A072NLI7_SCHAZ|nr:metallophosphoesterase [Schinkia azotoformans]KEF38544.1 putative phosphohydrolase [Schinkia azotoformans MEV2011]MEC1695152.1 metallophosphoesterase [Schinkia azotoformans]MEC1717603.1 metallophosphoesterase [Schinkia azotoformans]MEC1723789.1 metallophosphoesterase [Schinkia azotoformans]MEC1742340.1 metallophosphoesterase [Schinkia azotoformans]
MFLFMTAGVTLGIAAKIYYDTNFFRMNRIEFQSDKIPDETEFTILQISDLHNKIFHNNNEELIRTINKINANIVVITGDLIDRRTKNLKDVLYFVQKIMTAHKNVFYVSGNHEWGNQHCKQLLDGLEKRNVIILDNKNTKIVEGRAVINLAGVADVTTKHDNLKKALQGLNKDHFTLLLSHNPCVIKKIGSHSVDLILSGHTHGGQVRIPLIGALIVPDQGLFPKYAKGVFNLGGNRHLYIDSGLGTSRLPIRFLNQSQFSLIKITNNKKV